MRDHPALRLTMYALFLLSGVSGLIYQIVWTRLLVLVFGNTMLAMSTVLSAFMGGLAAGSYVLGRLSDSRELPLIRVYAWLEAGIGVYALVFPWLLTAATPLYKALYGGVADSIVALNLVRFAVCFALILVPTFLMGGTLPVLLKRFAGAASDLGHRTGFFYGLNTVGAVLGTVACGYFLLRTLGMRGTTLVAVLINLGVAVAAWLLSRMAGEGRLAEADAVGGRDAGDATPDLAPAHGEPADGADGGLPTPSPAVSRMVLLGIGVSGLCALAYEVFWTRMLNLFLHNNIYSFTAILATFLVGIAVGSLFYARFLARRRDQVGIFVGLQVAIGVLCYLTPYVFRLFHGSLFNDFSESLTLAKTAVIMVGPTVLMGIAVPLAVQICQRGPQREGTSVGTVYAVNTIGAIIGAFVAGFVLLPVLGLHRGVILIASLNVAAGFLVLIARSRPVRRPAWAVGLAAMIAVMALSAPAHHFRGLFEHSHPSAEILHYKEGKVANVVVYDFVKNGYQDLHLNAVEEASSRLWHVQLFKLLGILPVMVHDEPDTALMIAFGAGMSAGATAHCVDHLEVVDLNPDIAGVAEVFTRENLDVYNQPNFQQTVNDGRNALLLSDRKYPLIISDATNPKMFDSWTLYSREFYELVKSRLEPDGVFCQWALIPLPGDAIKVLLNTFRSVFPHMSFWAIYGSSQVLMLATPERLEIDYQELKGRLEPILASSGLEEFGVDSVEKFLSFFLLGEDHVERLLAGYDKISTDDLPHAQFHIEQDDRGIDFCLDLVRHQESILPYVVNHESEPGFARRMRTLEEISRRLNLGFLTGDPMRYVEAEVVTHDAGVDDDNVRSMLHYGPEKMRYFAKRLEAHPDDVNAHNSLAYALWRNGRLAEAVAEYERMLAIKPDFAVAHQNLALVLADQGRFDEAIAKLVAVREMNPTRRQLQTVRTQLEIVYLRRKLAADPGSAETWRALGIAYYNDGQLLRAIEAYRAAAEADPDDLSLLYNLARIMERHEFVEDAATLYRIVGEKREHDHAIQAKAQELTQLALDPVAQRAWRNARIAFGPDGPAGGSGADTAADTFEHPATCAEALAAWHGADFEGSVSEADLRRAAELYEASAAARPDDLHAYVDAATIREALGEHTAAAELWRRAGQAEPRLQVAAQQARRLELLAQIAIGQTAGEQRAWKLAEAAQLSLAVGEVEAAIALAREALELAPELPAAQEVLGQARERAGLG